ncbi:MAG: hypothetical protein JW725_00355 [Candidatus Babeliaceae bacterium]|nr:hypothetical protein [Candidatus Babeliaceae bacterium]
MKKIIVRIFLCSFYFVCFIAFQTTGAEGRTNPTYNPLTSPTELIVNRAFDFVLAPQLKQAKTMLTSFGYRLIAALKIKEAIQKVARTGYEFFDPIIKAPTTTIPLKTFIGPYKPGLEERTYVEARIEKIGKILSKKINRNISNEQVPRVALVLSGGGLRAASTSAGFVAGMDTELISYIIGLSGSTWFLIPWNLDPRPVREFVPDFLLRISSGFFRKDFTTWGAEATRFTNDAARILLRNFIYGNVTSVIDIYGLLLGYSLLDIKERSRYIATLITSQEKYLTPDRPFPIYTLVAPGPSETYHWGEITPYSVTFPTLNFSASSWHFGSLFEKGNLITPHHPLTAGFTMGACGSAFSINYIELYRHIFMNSALSKVLEWTKKIAHHAGIADYRLMSAVVYNPTYNMHHLPFGHEEYLSLVDAGIDTSVPLKPTLNPERKIDIIVILDVSGDVEVGTDIKRAITQARMRRQPFPHFDFDKAIHSTYTVFDDGPDVKTPVVIYVPIATSLRPLMKAGGPLFTFNMTYTHPQVLQAANTMKEIGQLIPLEQIVQVVAKRKAGIVGTPNLSISIPPKVAAPQAAAAPANKL